MMQPAQMNPAQSIRGRGRGPFSRPASDLHHELHLEKKWRGGVIPGSGPMVSFPGECCAMGAKSSVGVNGCGTIKGTDAAPRIAFPGPDLDLVAVGTVVVMAGQGTEVRKALTPATEACPQ